MERYDYFYQDDKPEVIFTSVFLTLLNKNAIRLKNFPGQDEQSFEAYLREISFQMTVDLLRNQNDLINKKRAI